MDAPFRALLTQGFILGNILVGASSLVAAFGCRAYSTSVPDGDIIATGEAVVVVVEPLVGVGQHTGGSGGWHDTGSQDGGCGVWMHHHSGIVVCIVSASTATAGVASLGMSRGWAEVARRSRRWCSRDGLGPHQKCKLLLGSCKGSA